MRRYADKRDDNEQDIIKYLKRVGCVVQQLSQRGVPDLLVGFGPYNVLMEVKTPSGKLTIDQESFFKKWGNSQVAVVQSRSDARKVLKQFMPIRVYTCESCGTFENKESIKNDPLTKCPKCDKLVIQVYSAPAIMFKGNGWGGKKDVVQKQPD